MKCASTKTLILAWGFLIGADQKLRADEIPPPYRESVSRGLEWLAKAQHRDGHWATPGGSFPVALTGLSGMALLMEGSTIREGRYADHIRRATVWLVNSTQPNGFINPFQGGRQGYMHGHGYALLFLAQVYGEEENRKRREELENLLNKAVSFLEKTQSSRGGWGYFATKDEGRSWDEVSVTITQMQALRACRNAGIVVPKELVDKAQKYFHNCTTDEGGVRYGPLKIAGHAQLPLTAGAIVSAFSAGDYDSSLVKRWFEYCRTETPRLDQDRPAYDEFMHYYWAQCVYMLGDEGWDKLFPGTRPTRRLTWSSYRKDTFDFLRRRQSTDGSWSDSCKWGHIGPVYATATALTILQLDRATLPIYQR